MKNIYDETKNNYKSSIGVKYTIEDVKRVWNAIASLIESNLLQDKGTQIADLGIFTLSQWSIHPGKIDVKRPVFRLAERLVQEYGYHDARPYVTGKVHNTTLSLQGIADSQNMDRCQVKETVTEVCQAIGRVMASKIDAKMPLGNLGVLEISQNQVRMRFYKCFLSKIDPKSLLICEFQKESGCLDAESVISCSSSNVSSKKSMKNENLENVNESPITKEEKTATKPSTPSHEKDTLCEDICECPPELKVIEITKEENAIPHPNDYKCYQKDQKIIPKYMCKHRFPSEHPPKKHPDQKECCCQTDKDTGKHMLMLENPCQCKQTDNEHQINIEKNFEHDLKDEESLQDDEKFHEKNREKSSDLCGLCNSFTFRQQKAKARDLEEENDIEKAKQLVFSSETKRKFAEDEMNQMIIDKRRMARRIECAKINHERGEASRSKKLQRIVNSDPDPSYIFYRRPDSPRSLRIAYRKELSKQIMRREEQRRKRHKLDLENSLKRLRICEKDLEESRKKRIEQDVYAKKKYQWELRDQMKRKEQIKEMFPESHSFPSDVCGITSKNRCPDENKKFAKNITNYNLEMAKLKQEMTTKQKVQDLEDEKNWIDAIRNESLLEGKCRAVQYFATYDDLKRSWVDAKNHQEQRLACERAANNREDGSIFDMKFQPARCKRCFRGIDVPMERINETFN